MLPNVDDDQQRCPTAGSGGSRLSDDSLAACNDSADDVVNRRGEAVTTGHAG
ncbi:hypothetical protein [Streptomyces ardesiacus]|uniref:hypothetical protein n=1 Tax=Streptomyces ardesiacus TaxID=285564 RepID=UPI0033BC3BBB